MGIANIFLKAIIISCFKGNNVLINSFTHKIETYSQTKLILDRLKDAKHKLAEELFQTATYLKCITHSGSLKDNEINEVKFLIAQLHLLSKQNHGQRYDAAMMKTAISFYFIVVEIVVKTYGTVV